MWGIPQRTDTCKHVQQSVYAHMYTTGSKNSSPNAGKRVISDTGHWKQRSKGTRGRAQRHGEMIEELEGMEPQTRGGLPDNKE